MKNLSFIDRMKLINYGDWDSASANNLVRINRPYYDSCRRCILIYLKKDYSFGSFTKFFSQWIPKEELLEVNISFEGHIAILIDEAIFRKNAQLEFDFGPTEKVTA